MDTVLHMEKNNVISGFFVFDPFYLFSVNGSESDYEKGYLYN